MPATEQKDVFERRLRSPPQNAASELRRRGSMPVQPLWIIANGITLNSYKPILILTGFKTEIVL